MPSFPAAIPELSDHDLEIQPLERAETIPAAW